MSAAFPPLAAAQLREAALVAAAAPPGSDLASVLYQQWYARPVTPLVPPDESWPPLLGVLRAAHAGSERWLPMHPAVPGGLPSLPSVSGGPPSLPGVSGGLPSLPSVSGGPPSLPGVSGAPPSLPGVLGGLPSLPSVSGGLPSLPGVRPSPREPMFVLDRRDVVDRDGHWRTWGADWPSPHDRPAGPLVRIYWNVGLPAVPRLVRRLTAALVDLPLPWLLRCPLEPSGYRRRDAAMLLVPVTALTEHARTLRWTYSDLRGLLRSGGPPLTLPVGRGVSVAEEPETGEGFGEHRSRLVAAALSTVDGQRNPLGAVARSFQQAGIDPSRPHRHTARRWLAWER